MSTRSKRRDIRRSINQYGVFPVTVSKVSRISENYIRISLTGPSLLHAAAPISEGTGRVQDAYIKLFIPPAGASGPTMIELDAHWRQRWFAAPAIERGYLRTYTVRDSRMVPALGRDELPLLGMVPAAGADLNALERPLPGGIQPEIDIDFVVHGQDGKSPTGPGSEWVSTACIGQQVSLLAPLRGSELWASWHPGAADRLLLLGDETALPAALSILRTLPDTARGSIYLEVPTVHDAVAYRKEANLHLAGLPGVSVQFLARSGGQRPGEMLYSTLRRACGLAPAVLPAAEPVNASEQVWHLAHDPHGTYAFIAGESAIVKALRRTCVQEMGLPKENISFMGYWKQGSAES